VAYSGWWRVLVELLSAMNQRQVLIDGSTLVELLYAQPTPADVIVAGTAGRTA
jgi:hypothetical protein